MPCTAQPTRSRRDTRPRQRDVRAERREQRPDERRGLADYSMPARRINSRSLCDDRGEVTCPTPRLERKHSAPAEKTARPALLGSHFSSPRTPKTAAMRPTTMSTWPSAADHPRVPCGRFAIENIDGDAALRRRADDRPQRLRNATAAADHLAKTSGSTTSSMTACAVSSMKSSTVTSSGFCTSLRARQPSSSVARR